jgi:hypothetical protein
MRHQIFNQTRRIGGLLLLIFLAGVCGCGHAAKVTGKVTYQGRPVQCGSVIFLSGDKTARSGVIELDSSYTVEGVPAGAAKIAVISRDPSKGRSVVRDGKRVRPDKIKDWFPLPQKFESPESSGFGCTVVTGHFNHDIELK